MTRDRGDSGDWYSAIFDGLGLPLLVHDLEGRILDLNQAASALFGITRQEVVGATIASDFSCADNSFEELAGSWRRACAGETVLFEWDARRPVDGSCFPVEVTLRGVKLGGEPHVLAVVRDISRRKRIEEQLRESDSRARLVSEMTTDYVFIVDVDDQGSLKLSWTSESYTRQTGLQPEQVTSLDRWLQVIHPEDVGRFLDYVRRTVATGEQGEIECRSLARGSGERWIRVITRPTVGHDGKVRSILGAVKDVTEKRREEAERAALEESLRQAQKMESIGRLAGGVAHDFNNLLTAIGGHTALALMDLDPGHPLHEPLTQVMSAVDSATKLTRQLLAFSRKQVIDPKVLDLNEVIRRLEGMLTRLIGEDVELSTELQEGLWSVRFDASQLEQVLVNLAVNARDAMPDGGVFRLETANLTLDEAACHARGQLQPGDYVRIGVVDEGVGMSEEVRSRIFEPFFTTKGQGKGTGLGLAMVYGAVTQHGGCIEVVSAPSEGARFELFLPRVQALAEAGPEAAQDELVLGSETVVVVEDEPYVRQLATTLLERVGYRVHAFRNGAEALAGLESLGEPVHLLVTDVVMPGMNGRALAERVLELRPGVRVLYTSGYTDDVVLRHGVLEEGLEFLAKPYSPVELTRRVREALDRPVVETT